MVTTKDAPAAPAAATRAQKRALGRVGKCKGLKVITTKLGKTVVRSYYATYIPQLWNTFRFSSGLPPLVKASSVNKNKKRRAKAQKARVQRLIRRHTNPKKHTVRAVPIPADNPEFIEKPVGKKRTLVRVPVKRPPAYYAPEHGNRPPKPVKRLLKRLRAPRCPRKLRKSLIPGKICIIVRGPYRGKRCVFLKQLDSGLCLITGPEKINNLPLERIEQGSLLATSTVLDLGKDFKISPKINDKLFRKRRIPRLTSKPDVFRTLKVDKKKVGTSKVDKKKKPPSKKWKKLKEEEDLEKVLLAAIRKRKDPRMFRRYLRTRFALDRRDFPHAMKF